MISQKFLKSSFIYTAVGALPLGSSVLLLPFYTNFLNTSDFGLLAIYISFTFLIQIIVNFGLDTFIGIHYIHTADNTQKLKESLGTVIILLLLGGTIFSLLCAAIGDVVFDSIFNKGDIQFFPYGFMSVLTAVFNSFFKTYSNLLINQQRPERFFWVNIFNFVLTVSISITGIYLYPYTLVGPMWGRFLSGVGIFLLALYFFQSEIGFHFKKDLLKEIAAFCMPITIYYLLVWVVSYIDRYIIKSYMTAADVGIFDFGVKCALLIEFLQMGLANSITPRILTIWKNKGMNEAMPEVNRYYSGYTAISTTAISLTILLIPLIVPLIVYKEQYYEAFRYVPILAIGFAFKGLYNMYLNPIYFQKKTKVLSKIFFISSLIQVAVSIFFIKEWGLWGVIWAGLISKIVQILLLYYESKKIIDFKFNKMKLIVFPVVFSIIIIGLELLFKDASSPVILHLTEFLLMAALALLIYRNELGAIKKMVFPARTV